MNLVAHRVIVPENSHWQEQTCMSANHATHSVESRSTAAAWCTVWFHGGLMMRSWPAMAPSSRCFSRTALADDRSMRPKHWHCSTPAPRDGNAPPLQSCHRGPGLEALLSHRSTAHCVEAVACTNRIPSRCSPALVMRKRPERAPSLRRHKLNCFHCANRIAGLGLAGR